jgi:hypothetical protein
MKKKTHRRLADGAETGRQQDLDAPTRKNGDGDGGDA